MNRIVSRPRRAHVASGFVVVVGLVLGGLFSLSPGPGGAGAPSSPPRANGETASVPAATPRRPRYHCPMHPTMVSDQPGDCPICGMRMLPLGEDEGEANEPKPEGTPKRIYRSTMNSAETSDRPGKDSMGMDMVPEEVDAAPATKGEATVEGHAPVKLSAQKRQLIGVRTAPVGKGQFVRAIRTVGRVTYDETRLRSVFSKTAGWVERLYANTTGQLIREGEPLLDIYSPELVASAQEYLLALRARDRLAGSDLGRTSGERLLRSARRRLLLFDLTPQQIRELDKGGEAPTTMTLHAPIGGHVISRTVAQGDRIEPGTKLLEIAELSRVWVLADIYEYELPFVHTGQVATITLSYLPGRTFEGRVMLMHPMLSETTRTVSLHMELPNPDFALKPEMYAQVEIRSDLGERLAVPESAVITTGTRDIAFVDRGDGYFEPRDLTLGVRLPDRFEVLAGLREGETVLTSGNFLVDSESKLKAALAVVGAGAGGASGHTH